MTGPVLAAVDLEHKDHAQSAVLEAALSARRRGVPLEICYVLPFGFYSYVEPYISEEAVQSSVEKARNELNDMTRHPDLAGTEVTTHILRGGVHQQIMLLAEKLNSSLIVLNATIADGNTGQAGPVTAQLARFAPCSVLILR